MGQQPLLLLTEAPSLAPSIIVVSIEALYASFTEADNIKTISQIMKRMPIKGRLMVLSKSLCAFRMRFAKSDHQVASYSIEKSLDGR